MTVFSERLRKIRKLKKMTQKQVAEGSGLSENQYQFYEYGKQEPGIGIFAKICECLNVSADYLLGLSDDSTRH